MDKKIYMSIIAALATAAAACLLVLLAAPIAKPLAWALIIGIATLPYYNRLTRRYTGHPDRAAGLMVLAVTVCFIMPVATIIVMVVQNAADWYKEGERLVQAFMAGSASLKQFPFVNEILKIGERFGVDLAGTGAKLASGASGYILDIATNTALNLWDFLFTLAVGLFILYFIYRDGERIVSTAIARFATDQERARRYSSEISATVTAVVLGTILTCLAQGVTAGIGYYVADVPAPILCASLTAVAAILPVVGTAFVWVPLVALVAINGAYLKALLLAIWCLVFVGLSDNAIRPLAVGVKSKISIPAIALGAICGAFTIGVLGLILGPVLFATVIIVWKDVTGENQSTEPDLNHTYNSRFGGIWKRLLLTKK